MVYLDYAATTPINLDVLDSYNTVCREFFGNPNSLHKFGVKTKDLLTEATKQIASLLGIKPEEIIYTGSATHANNIAIINACMDNPTLGKHIILSKLEHPSMYNIVKVLESNGYKIDYVNHQEDGFVDFDDLKKLIKKDTALVSICAVNSELGIRQPLKLIKQIIKKENASTLFHADLTQAIGKTNINFADIDLGSFSAHKFYGPLGIGVLYKSINVKLLPVIVGSDNKEIISQTPHTPLVVAMSKALRISIYELGKKEVIVKNLHDKIINHFRKNEDIIINNTKNSLPHFINISISKIKPETFIHALEEYDIFISSNTACTSGKLSASVFALTGDKARSVSTLRISLSYLTTNDEVNNFLFHFDEVFKRLSALGDK